MSASSPSPTVQLCLSLHPAHPLALHASAEAVSLPGNPQYGAFLSREALDAQVALPTDERLELERWLTGAGMTLLPSRSPRQLRAVATGAQLRACLGDAGAKLLLSRAPHPDLRPVTALPRRWAGYVQSLELLPGNAPWSEKVALPNGPTRPARPPAGTDQHLQDRAEPPVRPPGSAGRPPHFPDAVTPSDLRRGYRVPAEWTGNGEPIALMALGGHPHVSDLETFWSAFGIDAPAVEAVAVGPMGARAADRLARLETTMAVQWIGAMAPAARVVAYFIDPGFTADPWSAFLDAVVSDRERAPTVAVTTWSAPERQYYRVHGRERFAGLLDQAAALGVTVLAASGDWGVFDGFPAPRADGARVCDAPWPHGVFPAVESRLLSVGGTMVLERSPWREAAWSAPLSSALAEAVRFGHLAGGGGFSDRVPLPAWQRPSMAPSYGRGGDEPAVAPSGRGYPDVALMAWGAPDRSAGYLCCLDGGWRSDGGGTSLAAPVWAAFVACINQARRSSGRPRLGAAGPLFYQLARDPAQPFRAVSGTTDLPLTTLDASGALQTWRMPGYVAGPGWNPAAGLGVPDLERLISMLQ